MCREKLKLALQSMKPTGEDGFEGVIRILLSRLTNEDFILARSGDQPGGDAQNFSGSIAMQAKRYLDSTLPNEDNIEGDIRDAIRTLPNLDVYVLAITRKVSSQLQRRLDAIRSETGLDIVPLDYGSEQSELEVLCIEFWASISFYDELSKLDKACLDWINRKRGTTELKDRIHALKKNISDCFQSFKQTRCLMEKYLSSRFGISNSDRYRFPYKINLGSSICRTDVEKAAFEWWGNRDKYVAYLEGEEGTGKTWCAARIAKDIFQKKEAMVFWLDSIDWSACATLEDAISNMFHKLDIDDPALRVLMRKALSVWKEPILLILDGVNEYQALKAAKYLLEDFFLHSNASNLKILFTTRALENYPEYSANLWMNCEKIPIGPYNDDEFSTALMSVKPPLKLKDIPKSLLPIAKIPRYFNTCLELKDRFGTLGNITKEIVLWEDLQVRIKNTDPQLRIKLGWCSENDAAEIIAKLAQSTAPYEDDQELGVGAEILNSCFDGQYSQIRQDLKELKITTDSGKLKAIINRDHVVLGWALYILEILNLSNKDNVAEIANEVLRQLEPMPTEDNKTNALFTALQLSALKPEKINSMRELKRASLLYLWVLSHNADLTEDRILFWLHEDIKAYLVFTELFFEKYYPGYVQALIVESLAKIWKENRDSSSALIEYLKKWLLLVWSAKTNIQENFVDYKGHSLPIAKTQDQLRLSSIALSILSIKPDYNLLETLAVCRATLDLSYSISPQSQKEIYAKSLETSIGILMRWHYTEEVIPQLVSIASNGDEIAAEGAKWLARSLLLVSLPDNLQLLERKFNNWNYVPVIDLIKAEKTLFPSSEDDPKPDRHNFNYLATRTDLPDLLRDDIEKIRGAVEEVVQSANPCTGASLTIEDHRLDLYWSWYAKYYPKKLEKMCRQLFEKAIDYDYPRFLLSFLSGTIYLPLTNTTPLINLERFYTYAQKIIDGSTKEKVCPSEVTEALLWIASDNELKDWFDFISKVPELRESIRYYHILSMLYLLLPKTFYPYVLNMAKESGGKRNDESKKEEFSEYHCWCMILNEVVEENEEIYLWAREQILQNNLLRGEKKTLVRLYINSGYSHWFNNLLSDQLLLEVIGKSILVEYHRAIKSFDSTISTALSYEEIMQFLPQDIAGYLFSRTNRWNDFDRWGKELMELVCGLVSGPPREVKCRGKTVYILTPEGQVECALYSAPNRETIFIGRAASPVWGIDQGDLNEFDRQMRGDFSKEEKEYESWVMEQKKLVCWEHYAINQFQASSELELWSQRNKKDFIELSKQFLDDLLVTIRSYDPLMLVANAVVCILFEHCPDEAYYYYISFVMDNIKIDGIPIFIYTAWNKNYCNNTSHNIIRLKLLEDSKNDQDIMLNTLASLKCGSDNTLFHMVTDDILKRDTARDRCLGISVLAWYGTEEAANELERLKESDPSLWVRKHAEWAQNVCLQEKSCRTLFRQALRNPQPTKIIAVLQRIKSGLTPCASWWWPKIYNEENINSIEDTRLKALLYSYWNRWIKRNSGDPEIIGRRLKEFCRGEKVNKTSSPKMAPWWELS